MLRDRFDFILGNPPWLSYRYIADPDYQAEIKKRAVADYAIAPTHQKLFTQMELATIFLAHTLSTFARTGGNLGFVMPLSVLAADQHQNLRSRQYKASVQPIGTCARFALSSMSHVAFFLRRRKPATRKLCKPTACLPWNGQATCRSVISHGTRLSPFSLPRKPRRT
jgi:hypothetical protein